jgi:NAD-dependent dihydropyrimidine dehydrogenase PreA subunit
MTVSKEENMITRKIIEIDEDLCTGCGNCVITCAEGALEIIDGKAKVVNDVFCDGLGACIGDCPEGALKIIEREAVEFSEEAVEKRLEDLKHKEEEQFDIKEIEHITIKEPGNVSCNCPGSHTQSFVECDDGEEQALTGEIKSELRQWPIQMHLISPTAPYFQGADVLLSADCVAHSLGGYHPKYLKGKAVGIACPKLDQGQENYIEKIRSWIDDAKINTLTVITMQVPCCSGLVYLAKQGAAKATRKVPIKSIVVSLQGEILHEEWI